MRNFQSDLNRGLMGQQLFAKFCNGVSMTDGKKGDFLLANGDVVEVKADFYNINKSPNFFIERYSSLEKGSPGGPWQALAHNTTYFAYLYVQNLKLYIFETGLLVKELESLNPAPKPVSIKNKSWTTVGFKVPRDSLSPIIIYNGSNGDYEKFNSEICSLFGLPAVK